MDVSWQEWQDEFLYQCACLTKERAKWLKDCSPMNASVTAGMHGPLWKWAAGLDLKDENCPKRLQGGEKQ